MNDYEVLPRAQWSSYLSYVLVTTGAVVGLGNIFHFPFFVLSYGGMFVLFYVASELLLSIPLFFSELIIGRRGKQNPVGSISMLAMESNASRHWRLLGWLCFIIVFLTLSYYTVSVAFPLGYFFGAAKALLTSTANISLGSVTYTFSFLQLELGFLFFLFATMLIIARGINHGLEQISKITVPSYFLILFGLAVYASTQHDFFNSFTYLFQIPSDQPVWPVLFTALTFAFFKLNVGMGSMIVYGSYLPYSVPLGKSAAFILLLDALASLLAYFIICPYVLQTNLALGSLSYQNIIHIFAPAANGYLIATLFFLAAVVAAWTATIAMAESAVLTLIERFQMSRAQGVLIVCAGAILVGTIVVLSYTKWPDVTLFNTWTIAGFIQNFASDIATPVSALLIAIFIGWIVPKQISFNELGFQNAIYSLWKLMVKFLAPICILIILIEIGFN